MKHTRNILRILTFVFCIGTVLQTAAQTTAQKPVQTAKSKTTNDPKALTVLNKAAENYAKSGGVKANFSIKLFAKGGASKDNFTGTIRLKGQRFKIESGDMTTWFDGSNQWVYLESSNEVNLSKPSSKDLLLMNPVNVFQLYKYGYSSKRLADKLFNGKKMYQIELKPTTTDQIQNIVVGFDQSTYIPVTLTISNRDKSRSVVSIGSYQAGQTYSDALFSFQPKEFPDAEVIDLR
jgi:outer membrane lipoprotein-sorting protein